MKFYKIFREDEVLQTGSKFTRASFASAKGILAFAWVGPWIREVFIPDGVEIVWESGPGRYRAGAVTFGPSRRWADVEVLQELVDEGADVAAAWNAYPLRWAAENGHTKVVRFLLEHGANVHAQDDEALRWAAEKGNAETVRVLLEAGADVHSMGDYGIRLAAENGHTETVKVLLEHGADVYAWSNFALRHAKENGHTETVNVLKSYMENNS